MFPPILFPVACEHDRERKRRFRCLLVDDERQLQLLLSRRPSATRLGRKPFVATGPRRLAFFRRLPRPLLVPCAQRTCTHTIRATKTFQLHFYPPALTHAYASPHTHAQAYTYILSVNEARVCDTIDYRKEEVCKRMCSARVLFRSGYFGRK